MKPLSWGVAALIDPPAQKRCPPGQNRGGRYEPRWRHHESFMIGIMKALSWRFVRPQIYEGSELVFCPAAKISRFPLVTRVFMRVPLHRGGHGLPHDQTASNRMAGPWDCSPFERRMPSPRQAPPGRRGHRRQSLPRAEVLACLGLCPRAHRGPAPADRRTAQSPYADAVRLWRVMTATLIVRATDRIECCCHVRIEVGIHTARDGAREIYSGHGHPFLRFGQGVARGAPGVRRRCDLPVGAGRSAAPEVRLVPLKPGSGRQIVMRTG